MLSAINLLLCYINTPLIFHMFSMSLYKKLHGRDFPAPVSIMSNAVPLQSVIKLGNMADCRTLEEQRRKHSLAEISFHANHYDVAMIQVNT